MRRSFWLRVGTACIVTSSASAVEPVFFFFNDSATPEIYTLSLHDALPISQHPLKVTIQWRRSRSSSATRTIPRDRKSTRLNSSHLVISYAVFCLKKQILAQHKPHPRHTARHHRDPPSDLSRDAPIRQSSDV